MTRVNYIEFAPGLGTCGSLIYTRPRTSHLGKLTIGKTTVRNVYEFGQACIYVWDNRLIRYISNECERYWCITPALQTLCNNVSSSQGGVRDVVKVECGVVFKDSIVWERIWGVFIESKHFISGERKGITWTGHGDVRSGSWGNRGEKGLESDVRSKNDRLVSGYNWQRNKGSNWGQHEGPVNFESTLVQWVATNCLMASLSHLWATLLYEWWGPLESEANEPLTCSPSEVGLQSKSFTMAKITQNCVLFGPFSKGLWVCKSYFLEVVLFSNILIK